MSLTPWMQKFGLDWRTGIDLAQDTSATAETITTLSNSGDLNYYNSSGPAFLNVFQNQSSEAALRTKGRGGVGIIVNGDYSSLAEATTCFGVPVTNEPEFEPAVEILERKKATGRPGLVTGTGYDINRGIVAPSATYEFDVDPSLVVLPLWSIFQQGTSQSTNTYTFQLPGLAAGVDLDADLFLQLYKSRGASVFTSAAKDDDLLLTDAVGTGLTLTGSENEPLHMALTVAGRYLEDVGGVNNFTEANVTLNMPELNPYMWYEFFVTIQDRSAGTSGDHYVVSASGFQLNIAPVISLRRYNSKYPVKCLYLDYGVSGSLRIPWNTATVGRNYFLENVLENATQTQMFLEPTAINVFACYASDTDVTSLVPGSAIDHSEATVDIGDYLNPGSGSLIAATDKDLSISLGATIRQPREESEDEVMLALDFTGTTHVASNAVVQQPIIIRYTNSTTDYAIAAYAS